MLFYGIGGVTQRCFK